MILPNFLILGAAKAGTTALHHYLNQHPAIGMSHTKESNYLALKGEDLDFRGPGDADMVHRFSVTTEAAYLERFAHCGQKTAIGEASPLYLYSPKAPPHIKQLLPDAKLIAILRNPVDRAYSAFLHLVRDHRETTTDFLDGLRQEPARIAARWEHLWHYVAMGRYADQLARYDALFPREQITVYLYRDFRLDPAAVMRSLFRLLEVDETFTPDLTVRHNVASSEGGSPPVPPEARAWIVDAVRDDVARLEDRLDRDLAHWLAPA